ncbi:hypothetical protein NL676_007033 [Syzygium grande]|nr:hypothetical protein NL676_007033 [Syzygium grande]
MDYIVLDLVTKVERQQSQSQMTPGDSNVARCESLGLDDGYSWVARGRRRLIVNRRGSAMATCGSSGFGNGCSWVANLRRLVVGRRGLNHQGTTRSGSLKVSNKVVEGRH